MKNKFELQEHVYHNEAFVELVKDAVRFFHGTPVHSLPPPERFPGAGVYALYYQGRFNPYKKYADLNRLSYDFPIYVGKAVPSGWRQSRNDSKSDLREPKLYSRLREHFRTVGSAENLLVSDFSCRFVIFEGSGSDMIGSIEAALIKLYQPLWNSTVDGFGNHTPGAGRWDQAKSDWDVLHPGRSWAVKCKGVPKTRKDVLTNVTEHMLKLERGNEVT